VHSPATARLAVGAALLLTAACASGTGSYRADDTERAARRAEITTMLMNAASNWNRGDLDAFVDDYLPGAETTYIGSRGVLRGPAAIRAAYAPRFAPGGVRDSLSFELVDVDPIAPGALNVIATYILARRVGTRDSVTARGPTSLVMRRVDGRWRIVHDHSS
jgi:uncharacterized protein (TIGR02246 family)